MKSTDLDRAHSTSQQERAPRRLNDAGSMYFLPEVEQTRAQVREAGDDDLLVGDGRHEVGGSQHEGNAAQVVQRARHVTHVGALVVEEMRDQLVVVCKSHHCSDFEQIMVLNQYDEGLEPWSSSPAKLNMKRASTESRCCVCDSFVCVCVVLSLMTSRRSS